MTGTKLFRLLGPLQIGLVCKGFAHPFASMSVNHHDLGRVQRTRAFDDMTEQRPAGELVQDLGDGRAHPRSLARRQYHDTDCHRHYLRASVDRCRPRHLYCVDTGYLLLAGPRVAHLGDGHPHHQLLAGERMVAVDCHLAIFDAGDEE